MQTATSAQGDLLAAIVARLRSEGFLPCPAPKGDPTGLYRVVMGAARPEVQRLGSDDAWRPARLNLGAKPAAELRDKHQKFAILDAPRLLSADLRLAPGAFGCCVVYMDVDNFKAVNTRLTERVVDRTVLPDLMRLVDALVRGHGFAYAEGGDEIVVLLPNASMQMGVAFAESVRQRVADHPFVADGTRLALTVSMGLVHAPNGTSVEGLPELANVAKAHAKKSGKNQVCVMESGGPRTLALRLEAPQPRGQVAFIRPR